MKDVCISKQVYTLNDAAEILGVQVRTAREWIRKNKMLAYKKPGSNRWLIDGEEVERLLFEREC